MADEPGERLVNHDLPLHRRILAKFPSGIDCISVIEYWSGIEIRGGINNLVTIIRHSLRQPVIDGSGLASPALGLSPDFGGAAFGSAPGLRRMFG
jgi:hypothetical protein